MKIVTLLKRAGIPFEIVHGTPPKELEQELKLEVRRYVLKIEDAHRWAAKSTLHF